MCVYMILQAPKTCCQTALEEEKKKKTGRAMQKESETGK